MSTDEHQPVQAGDLQAYIEGEDVPHVAAALQHSPELQAELALLRRLQERIRAAAPQTVIPSDTDMIDVATGQATAQQRLRVAAYLRVSAVGRADMAALLEPDRVTRRHPLQRFLATPPIAATAVKQTEPFTGAETAFVASELAASLTLRVQTTQAGIWRLRGYLEQQGIPSAKTVVSLRTPEGRRRTRTTDDGGFFVFERLPAGSYYLRVAFATGILLTPPLTIPYDA